MARTRSTTAAIGVLALLATAACGEGTDAADIDAEGLASYACALVDAHVADIDVAFGDDATPVFAALRGASGLLGAHLDAPLPGYEELLAPAQDMSRRIGPDREVLQDGVDTLLVACADADLPVGDPDVSEEGRLAYTCALVVAVDAAAPAESWFGFRDRPVDEVALTRARAGGLAGLGGGFDPGREMPGYEELTPAAAGVTHALSTFDAGLIDDPVAAGAEHCRST